LTCKSCSKELEPIAALPLVLDGNTQEGEFCLDCKTTLQLEFYKDGFDKLKARDNSSIRENNLFRVLMLNVDDMGTFAEDHKGAIKLFISERKEGWEKLPIDRVMFFLDVFEAHARTFAEILHKKASLDELKLLNKKETEKKVPKEKKEAPAKPPNDGLTGTYDAETKKALLGMMKNLKLSEDKALVMLKSMMGQG